MHGVRVGRYYTVGKDIVMVTSGDGDVEKKDPPTFTVPKKLKAKGVTEADLAEVDRILEYNKLFAANVVIYCCAVRLLTYTGPNLGNNQIFLYRFITKPHVIYSKCPGSRLVRGILCEGCWRNR